VGWKKVFSDKGRSAEVQDARRERLPLDGIVGHGLGGEDRQLLASDILAFLQLLQLGVANWLLQQLFARQFPRHFLAVLAFLAFLAVLAVLAIFALFVVKAQTENVTSSVHSKHRDTRQDQQYIRGSNVS